MLCPRLRFGLNTDISIKAAQNITNRLGNFRMDTMLKTSGISIFVLTACIGLSLGQGPEKKFDFYPLKKGNRWTYVATDLKAGQAKADQKRSKIVGCDNVKNKPKRDVFQQRVNSYES